MGEFQLLISSYWICLLTAVDSHCCLWLLWTRGIDLPPGWNRGDYSAPPYSRLPPITSHRLLVKFLHVGTRVQFDRTDSLNCVLFPKDRVPRDRTGAFASQCEGPRLLASRKFHRDTPAEGSNTCCRSIRWAEVAPLTDRIVKSRTLWLRVSRISGTSVETGPKCFEHLVIAWVCCRRAPLPRCLLRVAYPSQQALFNVWFMIASGQKVKAIIITTRFC